MEPNWTICVATALIAAQQEIWLKKHRLGLWFLEISKWWVIGLWILVESFPSSSRSRTKAKKRNVGHGMIGILYIHRAKFKIAESNLIWVAKKLFNFEMLQLSEWEKVPTRLSSIFPPNNLNCLNVTEKKSVADYQTTNSAFPYRQLFIAHRNKAKQCCQLRVNKKSW